jgi:hypothetical protein
MLHICSIVCVNVTRCVQCSIVYVNVTRCSMEAREREFDKNIKSSQVVYVNVTHGVRLFVLWKREFDKNIKSSQIVYVIVTHGVRLFVLWKRVCDKISSSQVVVYVLVLHVVTYTWCCCSIVCASES